MTNPYLSDSLVKAILNYLGCSHKAPTLRYLNRLSDALFVWSRWASHTLGVPEILWEPNRAASGSGTLLRR